MTDEIPTLSLSVSIGARSFSATGDKATVLEIYEDFKELLAEDVAPTPDFPKAPDTQDPADFNLLTVPDYLADGDPWSAMDDTAHSLEPLLQLWETLPGGELNFPPDYPKMPGEPPRVQPSRKVAENWE